MRKAYVLLLVFVMLMVAGCQSQSATTPEAKQDVNQESVSVVVEDESIEKQIEKVIEKYLNAIIDQDKEDAKNYIVNYIPGKDIDTVVSDAIAYFFEEGIDGVELLVNSVEKHTRYENTYYVANISVRKSYSNGEVDSSRDEFAFIEEDEKLLILNNMFTGNTFDFYEVQSMHSSLIRVARFEAHDYVNKTKVEFEFTNASKEYNLLFGSGTLNYDIVLEMQNGLVVPNTIRDLNVVYSGKASDFWCFVNMAHDEFVDNFKYLYMTNFNVSKGTSKLPPLNHPNTTMLLYLRDGTTEDYENKYNSLNDF